MRTKGSSSLIMMVLVLALIIYGGAGVASYNKMISQQEVIENAAADIAAQLQRRADLIPNLVSSVKGYMEHETEVMNSITESREKLLQAASLKEQALANEELTEALQNFNLIVENYPDLKSNTNFIQLQDELAGTENRIATARRDYNAVVKTYNQTIKKIPGKLFASWFGFEAAEYFEAAPGSEEVPDVQF